jgi:hypothetical protein
MITGMADSLGISRSVALLGFLASAFGLATVTYSGLSRSLVLAGELDAA